MPEIIIKSNTIVKDTLTLLCIYRTNSILINGSKRGSEYFSNKPVVAIKSVNRTVRYIVSL